jgi:cobyric acid synthase
MKPNGKAISIQAAGTMGTGVGKSLAVSLLCRLFYEDGYKVAPFKALNLTNVTYKDEEGREFGYSQALQAIAAGIKPDYRTNPFTPKPLGNGKFDLILEGKVVERYTPTTGILREAFREIVGAETFYDKVMNSVKRCLDYLLKNYDIVCIEGSGPSKLLGLGYFSKLLDIPNMKTAELASAPVILLSNNLDSVLLTYMLNLPAKEKEMIKGVILNRFFIKDIEKEVVRDIGIPQKFFEIGINRIEKEYIKKFSEVGISAELIGYIPYLEELSKLPPLDPLFSDKRVDMETWKEIIPKVAKKVKNKINLKKIYKMINLI